MPRISVIVITLNEAANIERCLRSVAPFADEIVVVDSGSTDGTTGIAARCGARVISRGWEGYGRQKQFALENAAGDWIFSIDADEEVSPRLCDEIGALDFSRDGYEVPRKVRYLGRWITHGGWYPGYVLRLFRRDRGAFTDRAVHEGVTVAGTTGRLHGDLHHYSYRDLAHHVAKINHLSSLAAEEMHAAGRRVGLASLLLAPPAGFLRVYVARLGFLDGFPGFAAAVLHACYVFLKYAKSRERPLRPQ